MPSAPTDTVAAQAAHRASVSWDQKSETLASWFEAGEAVQKLLQPLRTRKRRIEAVSTRLLTTRREFWAERCAWMGATLKSFGSCFGVLAIILRFAAKRLPAFADLKNSAYGMYLVHYVFVVWLQYALLGAAAGR